MFVGITRVAGSVRSAVLVCLVWLMMGGAVRAQEAPGGFVESATSAGLRPMLSAGEIQAFLPDRGAFTFPAPYNTSGVRLTNGSDCGGRDCVVPVGYSYWRNINNHAGSDTMLVLLGLSRNHGGPGPSLLSHNKRTGETRNLGPLFPPESPLSWSKAEGWYFSATAPTMLYVTDSTRLMRYDISTRSLTTVFDVREHLSPTYHIKQVHSSNNDRVHSATVQDASYTAIGCVAYLEDRRRAVFIARKGDYDECQLDKSGRWLVVKENVDGRDGEDNRIIDLETGSERIFYDRDGAAGHSDLGYGYLVAEDNMFHLPGAVRVWHLDQDLTAQGQGKLVYNLTTWEASAGLGHVSHTNARGDLPAERQVVCSSSAERRNLPRVNEIVCYPLDGSLRVLVVAPNLVNLDASGGSFDGSGDYSKRPKGNLDPTGEYFIWTANMGGSRTDAFLVRVPLQRLAGGSGSEPSPSPAPSPEPSPQPSPPPPAASGEIRWMSLINMTASGGRLQKTAGCHGCPDASAVSEQQIAANGGVEFVAGETTALRFVGLSTAGVGAAPGDLQFAIRLQAGVAEVRESGAYRAEVRFAAGDTFRIAVEGGIVRYFRNGSAFYTSAAQASSAVRVHAVFFDLNASISGVMLVGGGTTSTPPVGDPAAGAPAGGRIGPYAIPRPPGSSPVRRRR